MKLIPMERLVMITKENGMFSTIVTFIGNMGTKTELTIQEVQPLAHIEPRDLLGMPMNKFKRESIQ